MEIGEAFRRLAGGDGPPDVGTAAATVAGITAADGSEPEDLLDALVLLRWTQSELAAMEYTLIAAARAGGVSWQALAPALGVASRQAAERRFLRLAPAAEPGGTRDDRVQAERDRRAAHRAVARWANDNTADLRRLAGQITALTGLPASAQNAIGDLNEALADNDAARLVRPLADTRAHLRAEDAELAERIDALTRHTDRLRRDIRDQRST